MIHPPSSSLPLEKHGRPPQMEDLPHLPVTHRQLAFWEQPLVFDPERFEPSRAAGRHCFAYFPFGGGPRLCIGNQFALVEAQLILATILSQYQFRLLPGATVVPEPKDRETLSASQAERTRSTFRKAPQRSRHTITSRPRANGAVKEHRPFALGSPALFSRKRGCFVVHVQLKAVEYLL